MGLQSFRIVMLLAATSLSFGQTALPNFSALSLDQRANIKITSFTGNNRSSSPSHTVGDSS
jgi:hypothetical protein